MSPGPIELDTTVLFTEPNPTKSNLRNPVLNLTVGFKKYDLTESNDLIH